MKKPHREHAKVVPGLIFILSLLLAIPCLVSLAPAASPITPSGLNTQVTLSATPPPGKTQFDITGGTRPGGGPNLFHSFGQFNVPNNNIANFLNDSGLATSNILGRVTGRNLSNIFGTIQTTGFGSANLFLMNPAGFLFGPNATINVGGMVTFTSADYLRLADGVRFNAAPHAAADALLGVAPVAAFGFLGSNPGAITVQGSQLTVAEGTGISLVGGDIAVQGGTLTAPKGQINLVSVGKPSHPHVAGEVVVASPGQGGGFNPTGFATLGAVTLSQGSTVDTSGSAVTGHPAGTVLIRGGKFVMDDSSITDINQIDGNIEVTADHVALSNQSSISTVGAPINLKAGTEIDLTGSFIGASNFLGILGTITMSAPVISIRGSALRTGGREGGGTILINGGAQFTSQQSTITAEAVFGHGGTIQIGANTVALTDSQLTTSGLGGAAAGGHITVDGKNVTLTNSQLLSTAPGVQGGTITMAAPVISIRGSTLDARGGIAGGTVLINGGARFTSQQSTISAQTDFGNGGTIQIGANTVALTDSLLTTSVLSSGGLIPTVGGHITVHGKNVTLTNSQLLSTAPEGQGGTIQIDANKVGLTDSQLNTSVTGGPQSVGGTITVDANKVTLNNSQVLSTATEGNGGTIGITTHKLNSINSVIDATSQTGTNGTVTIQHP